MKSNMQEILGEVAAIQARDQGGITRTSLHQIPEITEKHWPTLKEKLLTGRVQVREFAISPISFNLLAASSDWAGFRLFSFLTYLLPVGALALAYVYTWWMLLLIFGSGLMFRISKSFYRAVIFQGVTASEEIFCFLFSRNTICIIVDGQTVFRKNA
jgi:hypothetical protein